MKNKALMTIGTLALSLSLVAGASLFKESYKEARADGTVSYYDCAWDQNTHTVTKTLKQAECVSLTSSMYQWTAGWYSVSGELTINYRVTCDGAVNLILCENSKLTISEGIVVNHPASLHIYSQVKNDSDSHSASLIVNNPNNYDATIGGGLGENVGNICIYGGYVEANYTGTLTYYGALIGGGQESYGGNISIFGGIVSAYDPYYTLETRGAAIGSGWKGDMVDIAIYGGYVTAANYSLGAGIGTGYNRSRCSITIKGGSIMGTSEYGAGIGGGSESTLAPAEIKIEGGTVNASSNKGACIGGGYKSVGANVTVSGGNVTANNLDNTGAGVGIGAGQEATGENVHGTLTVLNGLSVLGTNAIDAYPQYPDDVQTDYATTRWHRMAIRNYGGGSGGGAGGTGSAHGFCIGVILLILNILITVAGTFYVLLRLGIFKNVAKLEDIKEKITAKEVLLTFIATCSLLALFLIDLISLIVHTCPLTIVSFILGLLLLGGIMFWYIRTRRKGEMTPIEEKCVGKIFKKKDK